MGKIIVGAHRDEVTAKRLDTGAFGKAGSGLEVLYGIAVVPGEICGDEENGHIGDGAGQAAQ